MESLAKDRLSSTDERLVLVSDTSTEAERLIASLRVRKVNVRDVPLMLLPGRVETQRPLLVICDGQAPRIVAAVEKMRQGSFGKNVELLLLGFDLRVLEALRPLIDDIEKRAFPRPIDVYTVLQRVEEVLGVTGDEDGASRSMASLPRVTSNPSSLPQLRSSTPVPRRRSLVPQIPGKAEAASAADVVPTNSRSPSAPPLSDPFATDAVASVLPTNRMSEELEGLLQEAERRLGPMPASLQPPSLVPLRLSPEQELDAILPADVLSALDEPVDLDDDDETSHPAHRVDRSSSMAPRGPRSSLLAPGATNLDAHPDRGSFTAATDEHTPHGRLIGRKPAASESSEPPSLESIAGNVMTPVPPSVKTHHNHPGHSSGVPSSPATSPLPPAYDNDFRGFRDGVGSYVDYNAVNSPAELDRSDSGAPGTNPEFASSAASAARDGSATLPPLMARATADGHEQPWQHHHEEPESVRYPRLRDEEPESVRYPRGRVAGVIPIDNNVTASEPLARGESMRAFTRPARGQPDESATVGAREPIATPRVSDLRGRSTLDAPDSQPRAEFRVSSGAQVDEAIPIRADAHGPSDVRRPSEDGKSGRSAIDIPTVLARGDVVRALARCVRGRYSGALAIEDDAGIRRIVMREGDFVMVASGIETESLVAFLIQRGNLDAEAGRLARKLPQFGRHAGAALIAHGYLRQDELWPVLRAHAEWLLGRAIGVEKGSAGLELELSARLQAEPAVFGGTTGAEVLVEMVRRIISPEVAIQSLGGLTARVSRGPLVRLLSECALTTQEVSLVEQASALTLKEVLERVDSNDFASAIYALVELNVLEVLKATEGGAKGVEPVVRRDRLDDEAVRHRILLRRGLVDEGDYFALLGISANATSYEVRHAYASLRREFEPSHLLTASTADLRDDVDLILEVLDEAYEILRDPARRERYRRALGMS